MITAANMTDRDGAVKMTDHYYHVRHNLLLLKKVFVDGGYTGKSFANTIKSMTNAELEVVKRNELHTFIVLPKRWIVERTFG